MGMLIINHFQALGPRVSMDASLFDYIHCCLIKQFFFSIVLRLRERHLLIKVEFIKCRIVSLDKAV